MTVSRFADMSDAARPVYLISTEGLEIARNDPTMQGWIEQTGFTRRSGHCNCCQVPDGSLAGALFGIGRDMGDRPLMTGTLAKKLQRVTGISMRPAITLSPVHWVLAWASTALTAIGKRVRPPRVLYARHGGPDRSGAHCRRMLPGARPGQHTGQRYGTGRTGKQPAFLAEQHEASVDTVEGDDLLEKNFPMIHAVGRASTAAPRLLDLRWGAEDAPRLTLVGKGVCFDTGGLDIKPAAGMQLMKKDMGGAANVIGLASMIMSARVPVRLRILIPAVENAIAGNAFRPGDILPSRKGLTVEIGNTDAEGRLVLADACVWAMRKSGSDDRHGNADRCSAGGPGPGTAALLQPP